MNTTTATASIAIPVNVCRDFLTTAYEGGSKYWLACTSVKYEGNFDADSRTYGVAKIIGCMDVEDEDTKWGDLDLDKIAIGIKRIIEGECAVNSEIRAQVLGAVLDDDNTDWDADTADCVVQAALFNEIVYG